MPNNAGHIEIQSKTRTKHEVEPSTHIHNGTNNKELTTTEQNCFYCPK